MVRTFQGSNLFPRMTVFENVQVALFARLQQTGSFSSRAKDLLRPEVEEILTGVSLENSSDMPSGFLSGGNKKKTGACHCFDRGKSGAPVGTSPQREWSLKTHLP